MLHFYDSHKGYKKHANSKKVKFTEDTTIEEKNNKSRFNSDNDGLTLKPIDTDTRYRKPREEALCLAEILKDICSRKEDKKKLEFFDRLLDISKGSIFEEMCSDLINSPAMIWRNKNFFLKTGFNTLKQLSEMRKFQEKMAKKTLRKCLLVLKRRKDEQMMLPGMKLKARAFLGLY